MAEYEPPRCEDPDCEIYAAFHVHVDTGKHPDHVEVLFLCVSHLRKKTKALKIAHVEYVTFGI